MKRLGILGILLIAVLSVFAQSKKATITGKVIDSDTQEAVMMANVRLLQLPDSTYVTGADVSFPAGAGKMLYRRCGCDQAAE